MSKSLHTPLIPNAGSYQSFMDKTEEKVGTKIPLETKEAKPMVPVSSTSSWPTPPRTYDDFSVMLPVIHDWHHFDSWWGSYDLESVHPDLSYRWSAKTYNTIMTPCYCINKSSYKVCCCSKGLSWSSCYDTREAIQCCGWGGCVAAANALAHITCLVTKCCPWQIVAQIGKGGAYGTGYIFKQCNYSGGGESVEGPLPQSMEVPLYATKEEITQWINDNRLDIILKFAEQSVTHIKALSAGVSDIGIEVLCLAARNADKSVSLEKRQWLINELIYNGVSVHGLIAGNQFRIPMYEALMGRYAQAGRLMQFLRDRHGAQLTVRIPYEIHEKWYHVNLLNAVYLEFGRGRLTFEGMKVRARFLKACGLANDLYLEIGYRNGTLCHRYKRTFLPFFRALDEEFISLYLLSNYLVSTKRSGCIAPLTYFFRLKKEEIKEEKKPPQASSSSNERLSRPRFNAGKSLLSGVISDPRSPLPANSRESSSSSHDNMLGWGAWTG
jgi:hypothetical protein